ncbi:hypothetical protein G6F37_003393 [Rhizopus arrhizus]|nr:hypothetical protein G6F37_003393 [Rhizopus arrhizus]
MLSTFVRRSSFHKPKLNIARFFSNKQGFDSLVLGAYSEPSCQLTTQHISNTTKKLLEDQLKSSNFKKANDTRIFYNVGGVNQVAIVSLGKKRQNEQDSVRMATALGIQALQKQGAKYTGVDVSIDVQGAAEGAVLSQFSFEKLKKNKKEEKEECVVEPYLPEQDDEASKRWEVGQIYGASQNIARMLMTSPSNLMTPKLFAEEVAYLLAGLENIDIKVYDEDWVTRQKMNAFLSVAQGSTEPLRFLEIHYKGAKDKDEKPYGLVGKGITFDSGGISLKPSANMALMKGDMGGAATVAGALYGISKMKLPVNIVTVIPLCENMPSGNAIKPGDVIKAMNGSSIEILNTDAEGRLILADALHYVSSKYQPKSIIDLATLTGAMDVALGQVFAGVFTNRDELWEQLKKAGAAVSDPFWRMPLHKDYMRGMKESLVADLSNIGGRSGGSCSAAGFLQEFVDEKIPWAHIDIAGVMECSATEGYHIKGMSVSDESSSTCPMLVEKSKDEDVHMKEANTSRDYVRYTVQDKARSFDLKIEKCLSASAAAKQLGIHIRTAQRWIKQYNKCPDNIFDSCNRVGRKCILTDEHKRSIVNFIDTNPSAAVDEVTEYLLKRFNDLKVSRSTVYNFMRCECNLSLKKADFHSIERNSPAKIEERYN